MCYNVLARVDDDDHEELLYDNEELLYDNDDHEELLYDNDVL
jgi:hypothetical protein